MKQPTHEIWTRLQQYQLDDPQAEFPFTTRLARENGWSTQFAERVVEEYKKYLFLAITTEHRLTPSDQVDQAWHLHLTYSHDFWEHLCKHILHHPFHHVPTRGGQTEAHIYKECYQETLDCYPQIFGEYPPPDIWPSVSHRFDEAGLFRRINTLSHIILPKRPILGMGILTGLILGWACSQIPAEISSEIPPNSLALWSDPGQYFIDWAFTNPFETALIIGVFVLIIFLSPRSLGGGSGCGGGGCGGD